MGDFDNDDYGNDGSDDDVNNNYSIIDSWNYFD